MDDAWKYQLPQEFEEGKRIGIIVRCGDMNSLNDLVTRVNCNLRGHKGYTPLMQAAMCNQAVAASFLLGFGADVHATSPDGRAAIHFAAYSGSVDVTRQLLAADADVNGWGKSDETPLMLASSRGNLGVMRVLLANGADAGLLDSLNNNAMDLAVSFGQDGAITLFNDWNSMTSIERQAILDEEVKMILQTKQTLVEAKPKNKGRGGRSGSVFMNWS